MLFGRFGSYSLTLKDRQFNKQTSEQNDKSQSSCKVKLIMKLSMKINTFASKIEND
jgi:hypothetical protein